MARRILAWFFLLVMLSFNVLKKERDLGGILGGEKEGGRELTSRCRLESQGSS
jgi:hypothetical protein